MVQYKMTADSWGSQLKADGGKPERKTVLGLKNL